MRILLLHARTRTRTVLPMFNTCMRRRYAERKYISALLERVYIVSELDRLNVRPKSHSGRSRYNRFMNAREFGNN